MYLMNQTTLLRSRPDQETYTAGTVRNRYGVIRNMRGKVTVT